MAEAANTSLTDSSDWQSEKSLLEASSHMLANEIVCDVWFLVGDKEVRIGSHKFILVCRSTVFEAMLGGGFADDKGDVKIPDIEPDVFRAFLT